MCVCSLDVRLPDFVRVLVIPSREMEKQFKKAVMLTTS